MMTTEKKTSRKTDNTVFVRFVPSSSLITRFDLEEYFGRVGPVKKCSVIASNEKASLGYGFVKYVTKEDALAAIEEYSGKTWKVHGQSHKLTVESASNENKHRKEQSEETKDAQQHETDELEKKRRKTNRVIVRNLSFYATEFHVKTVLEKEFGPVSDIHLPRVSEKVHRGFCFVTFASTRDAVKAAKPRSTPIMIKKRPVAIDYSTPKSVHLQLKQQEKDEEMEDEQEATSSSSSDDEENASRDNESGSNGDDSDSRSDDEDSSSDGEAGSDDEKSDSAQSEDDESKTDTHNLALDDRVDKGCTLFLRNLPFDAKRHDVFQLFYKFGHIESIFLVKDKDTGVAKGTAFLTFSEKKHAERVLEKHGGKGDGPFVTQRDNTTASVQEDGAALYLRGRRILCDLAVDKQTAATMLQQQHQQGQKDRRNLYLKMEGRVENLEQGGTWELLPPGDQAKRQGAYSDKQSKLQSPLYYINPFRLSIRNLAKHVTKSQLKQLCIDGIQRGLDQDLVSRDDVVAHWRASGEMTQRDILKRVQDLDGQEIPQFDKTNIKQNIPSVYIDCDFGLATPTSRGFGFVEFTHHVHALACLRELNNNPLYSQDYVAGGKQATLESKQRKRNKKKKSTEEKRTLIPRLIVEFTVENKAKAKKQAQHRAQQQANVRKQKMEQLEKKSPEAGAKQKKRRGKAQRERKRRLKDAEKDDTSTHAKTRDESPKERPQHKMKDDSPKVKATKPPKKQKVNKEEVAFENMLKSYRAAFTGKTKEPKTEPRAAISKKRWYE